MTITLRQPLIHELPALSQLCLRSKAYWGYDAAFMAACTAELTLQREALRDPIILAENGSSIAGLAQLTREGGDVDLALLYVDPDWIGHGVGQTLFDWCVETGRSLSANQMLIDADPNAAAFYEKMGAVRIGESPSESIPGRMLPQLAYDLR